MTNETTSDSATHLTLQLNARLQPMHRGEYFEDPLDEALHEADIGAVDGGGTMQMESGEVEYCDIEVEILGDPAKAIELVIATAVRLGAPKGSKIHLEPSEQEIAIGTNEGLGLYLNGTDLPEEVYKSCDVNHVISECERLLDTAGKVLSWWQGPKETALYLYGPTFTEMKERIGPLLANYPLCQACRTEQIA